MASYPDEEWIRKKYWDEGLTMDEIADIAGVCQKTVHGHMMRKDIPRRDPENQRQKPTRVPRMDVLDGYPIYRASTDEFVTIHVLVALAHNPDVDPGDLFGHGGLNVHHKNSVRVDNRPENLEVLTISEHLKRHWEEGDYDDIHDRDGDHWDEDLLREMYWEEGMTMYDIADELGVNQASIKQRFHDFGIETREPGQGVRPWHDEEVLRDLYTDTDNTQRDVCDMLGCSPPTLRKWLDKLDVPRYDSQDPFD